jgi:hypothetical protein
MLISCAKCKLADMGGWWAGLATRVVVDEGMSSGKTVLALGPAPGPVLQQLLHGHPELR